MPFNKKLYHISTISVADTKLDLSYLAFNNKKNVIFDESCLYIGQTLNNIYSRTKFEAECLVLDAISKGLDGYILRMGNLMPRMKDGAFQENILDNEFVNKIISFMQIGIFPDYLLDYALNFTPIDQAGRAIYKLVTHPNKANRIFHLLNIHGVPSKKLIKMVAKDIKIVSEKEFKTQIQEILDNDKSRGLLKNLINDFDNDLHLNYKSDIIIKADFTAKYLRKTFFRWTKISNKYLKRFISMLRKEIHK